MSDDKKLDMQVGRIEFDYNRDMPQIPDGAYIADGVWYASYDETPDGKKDKRIAELETALDDILTTIGLILDRPRMTRYALENLLSNILDIYDAEENGDGYDKESDNE